MVEFDWLAIQGDATRALVVRLLNRRLQVLARALDARQDAVDALKQRVTALGG